MAKSGLKTFIFLVTLVLFNACVTVGPGNMTEDAKKYVVTSKAYHDSEAEWKKQDQSDLDKEIDCAPVLLSAHHIREKIYGDSFKVAYGPYVFERTDVGDREGKFHISFSNGTLLCSLELKSSTQFWFFSKDQSLLAFHEEDKQVQVTKFDLTDACSGQYSVFFENEAWVDTIQKWRDLPACKVETSEESP